MLNSWRFLQRVDFSLKVNGKIVILACYEETIELLYRFGGKGVINTVSELKQAFIDKYNDEPAQMRCSTIVLAGYRNKRVDLTSI